MGAIAPHVSRTFLGLLDSESCRPRKVPLPMPFHPIQDPGLVSLAAINVTFISLLINRKIKTMKIHNGIALYSKHTSLHPIPQSSLITERSSTPYGFHTDTSIQMKQKLASGFMWTFLSISFENERPLYVGDGFQNIWILASSLFGSSCPNLLGTSVQLI